MSDQEETFRIGQRVRYAGPMLGPKWKGRVATVLDRAPFPYGDQWWVVFDDGLEATLYSSEIEPAVVELAYDLGIVIAICGWLTFEVLTDDTWQPFALDYTVEHRYG